MLYGCYGLDLDISAETRPTSDKAAAEIATGGISVVVYDFLADPISAVVKDVGAHGD